MVGLPPLTIGGLSSGDARALLDSVIPGRLDEWVRDRIVAETRGNPLALLELPRGLSPVELAGGFGLPDTPTLASRIERSFLRRFESLPVKTQRLLLAAAAEPVGEVTLLWRAAGCLGVGADAVAPAEAAGLIELGARVRFRHPLLRAAVYRAAAVPDRREVHRALAEATDPGADPDRRAWHRACAAAGPDEAVAGELERSDAGAQGRGGVAAAAAFLQRSAELTPDPARRGARALAAARAKFAAGAPDSRSISPAPTWCTANGCAASSGERKHASTCGPPTTCSAGSGPRRSPNGPGGSSRRQARQCASAPQTRATPLPCRRRRSPGLLPTATRTLRSAPSCSSALGRRSTTCTRCFPSSASAPAGSSGTTWRWRNSNGAPPEGIAGYGEPRPGSALGTSTDASAPRREGRCLVTHPETEPYDPSTRWSRRRRRIAGVTSKPRSGTSLGPRSGRR